jgi:hypothetical protein
MRGSPRETLEALRAPILELHRVLLDVERRRYEATYGRVSANELLGLALRHDAFRWLHAFSDLIVQLDELLAQDEEPTWTGTGDVVQQVRALLHPNAEGSDFEQRYDRAVQQNPEVLLAHRSVRQALPNLPAAPTRVH